MFKGRNINEVIISGLCLQCGTCVSICPRDCIAMKKDKQRNYIPIINERYCTECGLCLRVCPANDVDFEILTNRINYRYHIKWHKDVGQYINTFIGYSKENEIREKASSGGVVSGILLHLLQTGRIKGALVVRSIEGKPFEPEVFIARTRKDIIDSMQSKYHPAPLNYMLRDIVKTDGKIVIVGLPCHIHGLKKYEKLDKGLGEKIFLKIGLFCGLNLSFDSLSFFVHKAGKYLEDLNRISYREGRWPGKMVLYFKNGDKVISDKSIANHIFTLPRCIYCIDHTNELADISCGDAWLPKLLTKNESGGWSAIVSRTPKGQEVLGEYKAKNRLFLKKVDINEIIQSQSSMLIFKRKNSWFRLNMGKMFVLTAPNYDIKSLNRLSKKLKPYYLIGNIILLFIISIMRWNLIKNFIKRVPSKILKIYEIVILGLLYSDEPLHTIIAKRIILKIKHILSIL